jgi:NAD(P)-dependent dehydrogenase (short-subunit alcohol dehydrogenase family)
MAPRLADRIVVITGAGGGLGSSMARRFAQEGAELVLTDIDAVGLEQTLADVDALGAACSTHVLDLTSEEAIKSFAAEVCARHPKIHVLINNAGIAYGEINHDMENHSLEKWLHFFTVNSIAPFLLAQALRPSLAAAKGVIINQSSMASYMPANAYGITKATLNSFTYGMAYKFGADGIRVNAIAPGIMETPANKAGLSDETYTRVQSMQMLKLHGTAEDIANLAVFLASDDARFINCEIVHCDAGNQLRGWRG